MSNETNRNIKGYKRPSLYIKKFINETYGGNEKEFIDILDTHLISKNAYDCMIKDDFEGFISEREKIILLKIKKLIGLNELFIPNLISPEKPFFQQDDNVEPGISSKK